MGNARARGTYEARKASATGQTQTTAGSTSMFMRQLTGLRYRQQENGREKQARIDSEKRREAALAEVRRRMITGEE